MRNEQITNKEGIYLVIEFIIGSSLILGIGIDAKNDAWLAGFVGLLMAIPMILIYSRILSLFYGKDLFDILNTVFGRIFGSFIAILYIWYAFHLGALVLRNFGEFTNTVAMPETPMIVPIAGLGLLGIIAARLGIEVLVRTTAFFFPILFFILVIVQIFGLVQLDFNYLRPVLGNGLGPVIKGGFASFAFPFAETVLFLGVFNSLKSKKSVYKVYLWGVLIAAFIIIVITIRNITVLGSLRASFYFPSYEAVSKINIGDIIQRVEVTVSIVFIFGAFVKSSICLLVTCVGIGKLFRLNNYRNIVIQTGILMCCLAYIVYENTMQMSYWAFKVYQYYAFPMQVILPVILWIFCEIKSRKMKSAKN